MYIWARYDIRIHASTIHLLVFCINYSVEGQKSILVETATYYFINMNSEQQNYVKKYLHEYLQYLWILIALAYMRKRRWPCIKPSEELHVLQCLSVNRCYNLNLGILLLLLFPVMKVQFKPLSTFDFNSIKLQ